MNQDLMKKVQSTSKLKYTKPLANSELFFKKDFTRTEVPLFNLAFSGYFDKGFPSGLTMIAGPSKHFKSNIGLLLVRSYMKENPDAICLYYDSEFGITPEYINSAGLDANRIVHIPIMNIEELKSDIVKQLENFERTDKVIIFIDSVGNLASKKEVDDALSDKTTVDMTRAKQLKSLWRIATPYLTIKDIPCVVINHVYSSMDLFPKDIMSGGQGNTLSANTIFFISKAQIKEDDDIAGYKFTLKTEKSRFVKEASKFPLIVTYNGGISIYSGLLDIALETGHVASPTKGYYTRPSVEDDKKWRASQTNSAEFWKPLFTNTDFKDAASKMYILGQSTLISDESLDSFVESGVES